MTRAILPLSRIVSEQMPKLILLILAHCLEIYSRLTASALEVDTHSQNYGPACLDPASEYFAARVVPRAILPLSRIFSGTDAQTHSLDSGTLFGDLQ